MTPVKKDNDKAIWSTDTTEFRTALAESVIQLHDKRQADRIVLLCTIIGAIAVILAGVWFVLDLRFKPVEQRLDKLEDKFDVLESRVRSDDFLELARMRIIRDMVKAECLKK